MATLYKEKNGSWLVRFTASDGERRKIRLGKCSKDDADGVRPHIERMAQAVRLNQPLHSDTVNWLNRIGDDMYGRLANAGLCPARCTAIPANHRIAQMLDAYIAKRRADLKPWSIKMLNQCRDKLVNHFGKDHPISLITIEDAIEFKRAVGLEVSKAYVAKLVMIAKQFFKHAENKKFIESSPFRSIKAGSQKNRNRQRFVPAAVINRLIAEDSDPQRALIYALARYGGLRIPSELVSLRWSDIDFRTRRMVIHSPKTEHHEGKDKRITPLFPELVPLFEAVRQSLPDGEEYVVPRYRGRATNLRTHLLRRLKRLGIDSWPRLLQNLRSTRQTELCERFPMQNVCEWLGNTPEVAMDHYLQLQEKYLVAAASGDNVLPREVPDRGPEYGPAQRGTAPQGGAPLFGGLPTTAVFEVINEKMPANAGMCESD